MNTNILLSIVSNRIIQQNSSVLITQILKGLAIQRFKKYKLGLNDKTVFLGDAIL